MGNLLLATDFTDEHGFNPCLSVKIRGFNKDDQSRLAEPVMFFMGI
jgi:hypothetical protein